jgi:ATP-dependent protease Clp ATPase subunit
MNEYAIGQGNVKVALSVGVYNHYKRISVSEAQAAAESRKAARDGQEEYFPFGGDGGLSELDLSQFGSKTPEEDNGSFGEARTIRKVTKWHV